MNLFTLVCRIVFALILVAFIVAFEKPIVKHLEIGNNNLIKMSETYKDADKAVREYHKEYNEYLNKAF